MPSKKDAVMSKPTVSHAYMYCRSDVASIVYTGLTYSSTEMYRLTSISSPILTRTVYPPGLKFVILRLPEKVPSGDSLIFSDVITGDSPVSGTVHLYPISSSTASLPIGDPSLGLMTPHTLTVSLVRYTLLSRYI